MSTSFVELPENLEFAVGLARSELADQVKLMAALKMFELGKISSGKAAELAGMSRVDFFAACGRYRVSLVNTRPSLGHPGASSGASGPSDRFADRARGIAETNGASSGEWTRLRFNYPPEEIEAELAAELGRPVEDRR